MPEDKKKPAGAAEPTDAATVEAAQNAERARVAAVIAACKGHEDIMAEAVRDGWTAERAELACLKAEKAAAEKMVSAQFAENSDTYNYVYHTAAANFKNTMTSEATVGQIQSGISGMGLTSEGVVAALAQYYAANGFVDTTTGKQYSAAECQTMVPGTNTTYAAYFASATP